MEILIRLILYVCFLEICASQFVKAKIYAEDEGIPSGQISAVNEGKDGLLWVAHGKGISHYDGISWYTFADTLNLPRVQTRLEVSENNTIWVLGRGVFDLIFARYRSNQWQQLNIPQLRDNLTLSAFDSYANTDRFIISDSESIYMFNSDSGAWRPFNLPSGILVADLKRIKFIDHKLFLFFNDRVLRYDYLNNQVELISDQVSTPLDMIKLESRYIILAVNQLLSVYNQKKTVILENFLAGNQLNLGELHSNQNRLFFRSANFLHMYDLDSKNYYQLKTSFYGSQFQVSTLFFDHQDNLWITSFRGLSKINSFRFLNYDRSNGLFEDEVSTVVEMPDKQVFIGGNDSYSLLKNGQLNTFRLKENASSQPSGINRILDGTVFNGVTYVVSNTYGLGLVKATKIEWKKADKAFGYTSVIGFQNRLLVSHQSGLLYEFRNNQFTRIRIDTNNIRKMITIDDDLYLLGKDGVAVWNGKDYRLISNPNSNYANCFSIVKLNNTLLMGCIGGLYKLEDEQIKPALLDGFIFDVPIYSILNSGDGIWLGSNKGVYVIKDKQLRHYYNRHGFVGNEVNRSGMILNSNGSVMIGTDRGLSIYHKEYDLFDKPVPRTQLLSLTNENGVIFDPNKTNELAYNNRNLTFNYRAISLYDEEIINYRIRLAGFDANWKVILNAKQNSITYTNLPYGGPYTFMIQARSDDGEWSNELSSQPFYIRYPFYLTWWFMALLVLLIALIGYWINSYLNHARNNRYLQQRIDEKMSEIAAFNDQIIHQNTLLKREITDREKAEAEREQFVKELKEKNKELERYTYTVSHDLKSPLITIKGYIGLLKDYAKLGDIEKMTENVSTISSAADTMYQLLDDLVSITKIEKIESQFSEFNMIDVVNHVIDTLGPRLAEKKIKVEIADRMPVIFADKSRMVEVVKNLVDNAIKYSKTHKKNRIRINYQIDGEKHRFSVADNGIGIDMQYKDKIFGIFERLNLSIDGTGIGLAIVKSIIERHNGRVWVESDGPDKGSTFYFTLPLH